MLRDTLEDSRMQDESGEKECMWTKGAHILCTRNTKQPNTVSELQLALTIRLTRVYGALRTTSSVFYKRERQKLPFFATAQSLTFTWTEKYQTNRRLSN